MIKQIEILNDLIANTQHGVSVSNIIDNGNDTWTLSVNHTYYVSISTTVTIDSLDYIVRSFELNASITIEGVNHTTAPTAINFIIPPPTFRHGTAQMVNIEHSKTDYRTSLKYPFIWLVEIVEIDHRGGYDSLIDSVMNANLMFFTDNDKANWLIEDHYTYSIYPMLNEVNFFISTLESRKDLFLEDIDYKTTNHVNFGDYLLNRGNQNNIISDTISGVQLQLDLSYLKSGCSTASIVGCLSVVTTVNDDLFSDVPSGSVQNIPVVDQNGNPVITTIVNGQVVVQCGSVETFDININTDLMREDLNAGDEVYINNDLMREL